MPNVNLKSSNLMFLRDNNLIILHNLVTNPASLVKAIYIRLAVWTRVVVKNFNPRVLVYSKVPVDC